MSGKKHKHPKNNLIELQKAHPGSSFACLAKADFDDMVASVFIQEIPIVEAAYACAGLSDSQAGILSLEIAGYDVKVDCHIARNLSLFAFDPAVADKLSEVRAGIFAFSNQPFTLMVYREGEHGGLHEIPSLDIYPIIPFKVFQDALWKSIDRGCVRLSKNAESHGHGKEELYSYYLTVQIGLVRANIRLDIACAALKLENSTDFYGDEIVGVTLDRRDVRQKIPRWYILYEIPRGDLNEEAVANIDHVIPRAREGSLALRNLQLMRTKANAIKGDVEDTSKNQDRRKSEKIIRRLALGIETAARKGEITQDFQRDITGAIEFELEECVMPERGKIRNLFGRLASLV